MLTIFVLNLQEITTKLNESKSLTNIGPSWKLHLAVDKLLVAALALTSLLYKNVFLEILHKLVRPKNQFIETESLFYWASLRFWCYYLLIAGMIPLYNNAAFYSSQFKYIISYKWTCIEATSCYIHNSALVIRLDYMLLYCKMINLWAKTTVCLQCMVQGVNRVETRSRKNGPELSVPSAGLAAPLMEVSGARLTV